MCVTYVLKFNQKTHDDSIRPRFKSDALDRTHHGRPAGVIDGFQRRHEIPQARFSRTRLRSFWDSRKPHHYAGDCRTRLRHHICDSAHVGFGCDPADRLSWRRDRHHGAPRRGVHSHGHYRGRGLGRAFPARSTVARAHSSAMLIDAISDSGQFTMEIKNEIMKTNESRETQSKREYILTHVFDAPRDLVWKAFTDPEHMKRWWGPKGFTVRAAEMDFRPGGVYH